MIDYVQAWQCVGCGRIEAPQTCIGVCRDKKIFVIGKETHERALQDIARLQALLATVASKLARFPLCTPRDAQFERAFHALQQQAGEIVALIEANGSGGKDVAGDLT